VKKRRTGSHPRRYPNPRMRWNFGQAQHEQRFADMLATVCGPILRGAISGLVPLDAESEAFLRTVIRAAQGNARRRENMVNATPQPFDVGAITVDVLLEWEAAASWELSDHDNPEQLRSRLHARREAKERMAWFYRLAAEFPIRRVAGAGGGDDLVAGLSRHLRDAGPRRAAARKAARKSGGRPANDNTAIYEAADAYVGPPRRMAAELAKVFHKTPGQIRRILRARNGNVR